MNHADLGREVKRLHPGHYDMHPDHVVGMAMVKRFPGIYDDVKTPGMDQDSHTVPELPKTLRLQMEQLANGQRKAVFVPRGSKIRIDARQYKSVRHQTPAGDVFFNPKLINRAKIDAAFKNHDLNEILGSVHGGYGAPAKQNLKPPVEAVVSRDHTGTVAHDALTDKSHEESALAVAHELKPPGGSVGIESPEKVVAERMQPIDEEFQQAIQKPGIGDVVLISGGNGRSIPKSGPMKDLLDHAKIVREIQSEAEIDAAVQAKNNVVVVVVKNSPEEQQMESDYQGNPRVHFITVDNTKPGKARVSG